MNIRHFNRIFCAALSAAVIAVSITGCTNGETKQRGEAPSSGISQPDVQIESQPRSSEDEPQQPKDTVITVKPGDTIDDIAAALERDGLCSAQDFKESCKAVPDIELFSGYEPVPERVYPVEGYILAGEYSVLPGLDAQGILDEMLDKIQREVTPDMIARSQELDMSFDEIITLASIVQLESKYDHAMPGVSAVFHSRLDSPDYPYLQSDMTKSYADGAYDTYKVKGLPAGAVCSPTIEAVTAALYPQEGLKAYYFVYDTNGEYYYAEDYSEHKANIKALKEKGIFDLW